MLPGFQTCLRRVRRLVFGLWVSRLIRRRWYVNVSRRRPRRSRSRSRLYRVLRSGLRRAQSLLGRRIGLHQHATDWRLTDSHRLGLLLGIIGRGTARVRPCRIVVRRLRGRRGLLGF
jgi:hypothetical protein